MTHETADRMQTYGGSFARAIAQAWIVADDQNRALLEATFGHLFERYEDSK